VAAEHQTHDYYMHYGPYFADPAARQLYAEIASIEEQHVTQYESMIDASESWIEKWLLHEANEVYNYYSCVTQEEDPRIKAIWERFLDYELGHLQCAIDVCKEVERRDPSEFLPESLPEPIAFKSNREYVRQVLRDEVDLRANGPRFVDKSQEPERSLEYRRQMNADGSPSDTVSAGWQWSAGGELMAQRWLKEAA
jgi:rubrerythrin